MILSARKIAALTAGKWQNLDTSLELYRFSFLLKYAQDGDFFICYYSSWYNKKGRSNEDKALRAINRGTFKPAALMLEGHTGRKIKLDKKLPILWVDNTYRALKKLALYVSKRARAKRLLVTGSYGKTAFKIQLFEVLKHQKNTQVTLNSVNQMPAIYTNLASLRHEDELLLIEIPVNTVKRTKKKSGYIRPDICVLTSIGHEHIEKLGSIDEIIRAKLAITHGMDQSGVLLLPADSPYYERIKHFLPSNPKFAVKTFGEKKGADARVIYKKFERFGWYVTACIAGQVVSYRVPFPEVHAVDNSLAVLLSVVLTGADLYLAASRYYRCYNFKSSGICYDVVYKDRHFTLYDQSYRGGIEGYQSFFETLAQIRAGKGRKILLTSEFVDYKDGEMQYIDQQLFQRLIENAGIDKLYTVEKFPEHMGVLADKNIWVNHSFDFNNIKDEVINTLKKDDIFCVKGIFESKLPDFIQYIRQLPDIKINPVVSGKKLPSRFKELNHLKLLDLQSQKIYQNFIENSQPRGWCYYFPFLYCWTQSPKRFLLYEIIEGSFCLYLLSWSAKRSRWNLNLFFPPLPFHAQALQKALERVQRFKRKKRAAILWLDNQDVIKIRQHSSLKDLRFHYRSSDFIYQGHIYQDISSRPFKYLRRVINRTRRIAGLKIEPYSRLKHETACLQLLKQWQKQQKGKISGSNDVSYTRHCLENYDRFSDEELFGVVLYIEDSVKAFGFAGKMTSRIVNLFVGKSDTSIQDIHSYIKYYLIQHFASADPQLYFNDGPDMGNPGLAFIKQKFRPVLMLKNYRATLK